MTLQMVDKMAAGWVPCTVLLQQSSKNLENISASGWRVEFFTLTKWLPFNFKDNLRECLKSG